MIECDLNCERTTREARRPSSQEELIDLAHKESSYEPGKVAVSVRIYRRSSQKGDRVV